MSVRLATGRSLPLLPGTVVDTLIVFSGWGANNVFNAAVPLPHMRGTNIPAVDLWLDADDSSPAGAPLASTGFYGILSSSHTDVCPLPDNPLVIGFFGTLQSAWAYLEAHFDPRGKLIIYGNSAGGDCALNLCRSITECKRWYWYGDPANSGFSPVADSSEVLGETCVDLLVTVDAAAGPGSDLIGRDVAPAVTLNNNYYQLNSSIQQELSHGAPNVATDPSVTTITNDDWTDRADHYSMGWQTRPLALAAINTCRGI